MPKTLYVDLDGTLVKTDMLSEGLLKLTKDEPRLLLRTPGWLFHGKGRLKGEVARHAALDPSSLPYNEPLLSFLKQRKEEGTPLVLATGAHHEVANAVAEHTRLFDRVHSSTDDRNLTGHTKLQVIQAESSDFAYAGNSIDDLPIWKAAGGAVVVGPRAMRDRAAQLTSVLTWFAPERHFFKVALRTLRVHQWTKNLLVFLPLALAHEWMDWRKLLLACWTFITFSIVASGVYITNDLCDLEADRKHPDKRHRPLASGDLSIRTGLLLVVACLGLGFGVASIVSIKLLYAVVGYFLLTTLYSLRLKRIHLFDGFTLAGLYSWRVLAGGKLTEVQVTFWLIAFCMFFFLSLAFVKRATELMTLSRQRQDAAFGRGYRVSDLDTVRMLGMGAGIASIAILAMYMNHPGVSALYSTPSFLLGAAIALFYWICRLWLKTDRHEVHSDPIVFAIKDRVSYAVLATIVLFGALAKLV